MSNFASKLLTTTAEIAQRATAHPKFWDNQFGELTPDLYQIDLALETLESLERATARAKAELESLRPGATERARLEYQGGVNRA